MKSEHKDIVDYLSAKIENEIDEYLLKSSGRFYGNELACIFISIHITSLFNLLEKLIIASPIYKENIEKLMREIINVIKNHENVTQVDFEKREFSLQ